MTNDGATILSLLDVEHPAGKILVDLAQQQDKEVGQGEAAALDIHLWWTGRRWNNVRGHHSSRTPTKSERAHEESNTSYYDNNRLPPSAQGSCEIHE